MNWQDLNEGFGTNKKQQTISPICSKRKSTQLSESQILFNKMPSLSISVVKNNKNDAPIKNKPGWHDKARVTDLDMWPEENEELLSELVHLTSQYDTPPQQPSSKLPQHANDADKLSRTSVVLSETGKTVRDLPVLAERGNLTTAAVEKRSSVAAQKDLLEHVDEMMLKQSEEMLLHKSTAESLVRVMMQHLQLCHKLLSRLIVHLESSQRACRQTPKCDSQMFAVVQRSLELLVEFHTREPLSMCEVLMQHHHIYKEKSHCKEALKQPAADSDQCEMATQCDWSRPQVSSLLLLDLIAEVIDLTVDHPDVLELQGTVCAALGVIASLINKQSDLPRCPMSTWVVLRVSDMTLTPPLLLSVVGAATGLTLRDEPGLNLCARIAEEDPSKPCFVQRICGGTAEALNEDLPASFREQLLIACLGWLNALSLMPCSVNGWSMSGVLQNPCDCFHKLLGVVMQALFSSTNKQETAELLALRLLCRVCAGKEESRLNFNVAHFADTLVTRRALSANDEQMARSLQAKWLVKDYHKTADLERLDVTLRLP